MNQQSPSERSPFVRPTADDVEAARVRHERLRYDIFWCECGSRYASTAIDATLYSGAFICDCGRKIGKNNR